MCTAGLAGSSEQVNAGLRLPDASAPPSVARNVCQLIPSATAATRPDLQRQPGAFREHYNEHRPNRAVQRSTPGQAYRALP